MNQPDQILPAPGMEPQRVDIDQYHAYAPEKFELLDGYLFYGPEDRLSAPAQKCAYVFYAAHRSGA